MPVTNSWLQGAMPDRVAPRPLLEDRILNLFSTRNMAVIATTFSDGSPAATPVRFYSLEFEIMYTSWNASREAFRWQSDHVERGRRINEPPTDPLTIITPERIVYTEHWLRKAGYRPRQVWRPE